jgi:hypothetical protein
MGRNWNQLSVVSPCLELREFVHPDKKAVDDRVLYLAAQ